MVGIPITALLHFGVVFALSFRILYRRLAVNTTLAWIIIIAALPIGGIMLYFLFGDHRLGRKRLKLGPRIRQYYQSAYDITDEDADGAHMDVSTFFEDLSDIVSAETGFYPSMGNSGELFQNAELTLEALMRDIDSAKENCFLEFYIIQARGRVVPVLEALERAAIRGVDCRILADDFGSGAFFKCKWHDRLVQAGVKIVRSLPVGLIKSLSKRTDLRNHRKIVIIDQSIGYIGSFNLVDPAMFKKKADVGEWVDIMLRIEGHIVSSLACVFNTDFIFDNYGADFDRHALRAMPQQTPSEEFSLNAVAQLIPSGPEMRSSLIYEVIVSAIFGAREQITIITPYFVPDEALLMAMSNAARRGLDVRLILPKKIDSKLARYAGESVFEGLLESGVKIFRFNAGMLHTKAILIDDSVSFIGTVNMDMRSFYLNLEVTLAIYDTRFSAQLAHIAAGYIAQSDCIDLKTWRQRTKFLQFKENVLRLTAPLL